MPEADGRELTFAAAIREALAEEIRRDPSVFILGEDVAEAGTPFWYENSNGLVEIALSNGHAAGALSLGIGSVFALN